MPDYISRALGTNGASGNARCRQFEFPNGQADVRVELYPARFRHSVCFVTFGYGLEIKGTSGIGPNWKRPVSNWDVWDVGV